MLKDSYDNVGDSDTTATFSYGDLERVYMQHFTANAEKHKTFNYLTSQDSEQHAEETTNDDKAGINRDFDAENRFLYDENSSRLPEQNRRAIDDRSFGSVQTYQPLESFDLGPHRDLDRNRSDYYTHTFNRNRETYQTYEYPRRYSPTDYRYRDEHLSRGNQYDRYSLEHSKQIHEQMPVSF
ncbi:unnamed protein product [Mytilus coruscus]|uniref:Uncharacterized protein n=1 Tax=Mytilus coruscus TaxID=42192 RepID=A0A6J8BCD1_MYTCO|nr:unnamed protein product [Mytilus coruscus]